MMATTKDIQAKPPDAAPHQTAPRFALGWASLVYTIAVMLLAYPALAGKFLVNPHSDQYIAGYAFRDYAAQYMRTHGGFPLWNPYLYGGMPYVAAMHGDIFYPTFLLRLVLPTDVAMTWSFIVHVFLAGVFAYVFLRACGIGFYGALVGGLAYMMGGNVAGLVSPGHDGKLYISALLPLTLLLVLRGVHDGRRWASAALAVVIGLAVLSPHPQLLQYLLLVAGAFGLYLAFAEFDGLKLERPVAIRRLALAAASVVLGAAIGAIQYLPVREYVPFSPRAGGKGWEHAVSYSMPPEELINFYLPQFSGILDNYWGRNVIHFHSEYIGAATLLLATAGLIGGDEARKGFRRFWIAVLAISVLWSLGGFTPFYHIIYAIVPGTKFFRAPSTMLMVVALATAVLAALGTERALAGALTRRFLIGWLVAAGVMTLLAVSGGFTAMARVIAAGFAGGSLDPRSEALIDANRGDLAVGGLRSLLFLGVTVGLLFAAALGRIQPRVLGWALAAVVAIDLWSVERRYWLFSPPADVIYGSDPAIAYVQKAEPGRVVAVQLSEDDAAFRDPFLGGDALMAHRIRLVAGYHGNEIGRYQRLLSGEQLGDRRNLLNPSLWRLTNARYLYTNVLIPDSTARKLVGPVKNASGSTVYLYRLPGDNPPAWVTPAFVKAGDEATAGTILDPRFDPLRVAVFDSASTVSAHTLTAPPEPPVISTRITRYDPGHISLELSAPAPAGSALVVSENYFPGWSVRVDGRPPVPAIRTDYTFLGAPLPAGATRISLDFSDPAYDRGKTVTIVAVLVALLALGAGFLLDHRRSVV